MAVLVKANEATATRRRVYFHLVDVTDGLTPETGEAGGQPQVATNGGAWTDTGIGTLSHIGNGRYYADLTQTLVATAGDSIETRFKSANTAETPGDSVRVVAFDPYDAVRLGVTALPNAAADAAGGLPISDAGGLDLDGVLDAAVSTRQPSGAVDLNADQSGVTIGTVSTLTGHTAQTGDSFARLGAPAGASVSADVAAVKVQTADIETDTQDLQTQIGTAGAGLTDVGGMSTAMKAEVNAECDTALSDYDPPTNAEMVARTLAAADYSTAAALATVDANVDAILADTNELQGDLTDGGRLDLIIDALRDLAEADTVLDTGTTPWTVHLYRKGTTTDLVTPKQLKDSGGTGITAATTPVATVQQP